MTRKCIEELTDADLDAVAGGYKLDRVFVKSWSISGDADDRPTIQPSIGFGAAASPRAGELEHSWKTEEGEDY